MPLIATVPLTAVIVGVRADPLRNGQSIGPQLAVMPYEPFLLVVRMLSSIVLPALLQQLVGEFYLILVWREKTDKEKSHKGIWRSGCPGGVPGTNSGRS